MNQMIIPKYKNKNSFLIITPLVFLIFTIFLISQETLENTTNDYDAINNYIYTPSDWKYSVDKENWFQYNNTKKYEDIENNNIVWLRATLPDIDVYSPAILIYTLDIFYDIYFNDEVYSYNQQNLSLHDKPGNKWDIITLPLNLKDNEILIKAYKNNKMLTNFNFYLTYSNSYTLFQEILKISILKTAFSAIFFAIGIVLFITIFIKNQISHPFYLHGITSIIISAAIFAGFNPLSIAVHDNPIFWGKLESVLLFHISIPYVLYLKFSLKKFDKFITIYLHAHLLITFLINLSIYISYLPIITVDAYFIYFSIASSVLPFFAIMYKIIVIIKNHSIKAIKDKIKQCVIETWLPIITISSNVFNYLAYASFSSSLNFVLDSYYEWILLVFFCIIVILYVLFLRRVSENYTNANYQLIKRQMITKNLINSQRTLMNTKEYTSFARFILNKYISILFPNINTLQYDDHYLNLFNKKQIYLDNSIKYNILKNTCAFIAINTNNSDEFQNKNCMQIIYATGKYKSYEGLDYDNAFSKEQHDYFIKSADYTNTDSEITILVKIEGGLEAIIHFSELSALSPLIKNTLKTFLTNSSIILKNLILINKMHIKQKETIFGLSEISEVRSKETGNHIRRVSYYSKILAQKLGLPKEDIDLLSLASTMHDIGKLAIPDNVLHKKGKLTDDEFTLMKEHAKIGYKMLNNFDGKLMNMASIIALEHHEKYDGSGYYGKSGEDINIFGRIVAVADVFDALGSERVYKKAWPLKDILDLFKKEKGKHFDPVLVDILFDNLDEFLKIKSMFADQT